MMVLQILLWVGAVLWIVFFIQLLVNRILTRDLSRINQAAPEELPFVSIVVPARNEERQIREAVTSFCGQDYPSFEVVVVDDRSTDATPRILSELQSRFVNLRVVAANDPPPGWLGKPNALETGRKAATGEWLLFVDADVVYAPDLLRRSMAYVLSEGAAMLFLAPDFQTRGAMEAALMSSLYLVGAAMIPFFLVTRSRSKRFAAGGGVFNLVRRDALAASRAFQSLKNEVIDDMGLGYRVKGAGFRLAGALAGPLIRIRMYESAAATVRGFTKNVYPMLRKVPWLLPIPVVLGSLLSLLPYAGFLHALAHGSISVPATLALCFMHLVFAGIAIIFRQPWYITFLNPLRELGWWWILLRSSIVYHRAGVVWRGRAYGNVA